MTNDYFIITEMWGQRVSLDVVFDAFEGEEISSVQRETSDEFESNFFAICDVAYARIKEYCINNYETFITDNFENIFRYVMPKQIYIKRSVTNKRILALLCNFKFDLEHGLAVVFENGKFKEVGPQDIIL